MQLNIFYHRWIRVGDYYILENEFGRAVGLIKVFEDEPKEWQTEPILLREKHLSIGRVK